MFIDEAYDLNPVGDFKGKPIVSELLTVAENQRDRISIIIAGYEDDMEERFYKFNDGLKSRFTQIAFEDFDEADLLTIWDTMLEDRSWTADERAGKLVVKKLAKQANRKGFGNARAVRKQIEEATKKAMARDGWDGDMELQLADLVGEHPAQNVKLQQLVKEIEDMTGWAAIKKTVREFVALCGRNFDREILAGQEPLPVCLNRLFLGNPGTGKTTCAKVYGRLLKHLNFLSNGDVVVKTASDFVGSVVGESQSKTNAIIESARGKVLVIDEAYNLDDNMYGKQVLDVFVEKIQGTPSDDIAVLLLGYEEPMLRMIRNANRGLARRFPRDQAFVFEDYTERELMLIFDKACEKQNVKTSSYEVVEKALQILQKQKQLPNFGNAGAVNTLIQRAIARASAHQETIGDIILCPEDLDVGTTPHDQNKNTDPFAPLSALYRVDNIRQALVELRNAVKVAQEEGSPIPEIGHFVFAGSPGTGKTTVARSMAKILHDMGILSTGTLVETTGQSLTAEYVGQTKKKVEEKLGEARGGVLFIDEAYDLGHGPFGRDAINSLVAAMTSPTYKGLVIIIAGYPKDMDQMLNCNEGLKSRFTRTFSFEDWLSEDCITFFLDKAERENFSKFSDSVIEIAKKGFEQLRGLPGWGNGRDVMKIWKDCLVARSNRVVDHPEMEKTITEGDVEQAFNRIIAARKPPTGPLLSQPPSKDIDWSKLVQLAEPSSAPKMETSFKIASKEANREAEQKVFFVDNKSGPMITKHLPQVEANDGRDAGVSDEDWAELEKAKEAYKQRMIKIRAEMDESARQEEIRKQQAIQEKIRQICLCPAGFQWFKMSNGWRCGGGSHYVTDRELQAHFTC